MSTVGQGQRPARRRMAWWGWLALVCAVVLVPWIVYIRLTLPRTYLVETWNMTWSGFDVILAAAFVATAVAAWRRKPVFVLLAAMTGTLLLLDAWFDGMMAREPEDAYGSLWAMVLEVPLGLVLLGVSYARLHQLLRLHHDLADPPVEGETR